jgi:hypothetical protein
VGYNFMVVVGPYRRVSLGLPGEFGLWLVDDDKDLEDDLAAAIADVVRRANEVMAGVMGMPKLEKLEIVKASVPGKGKGGKGPLGLVLVEWGRDNPFNKDSFLWTMTHEVCHQWFPGPINLDPVTGLWLSEGMATYFHARHVQGGWPLDEYLSGQKGYQPSSYSINSASAKLGTVPNRDKQQVIYLKGAWVAHMLRKTIGDEAFRRTLQRFYTQDTGDPKGTTEFQELAEEESGLDLDRFFQQWLGTTIMPEISMENVTVRRANSAWQVRGTITNLYPMPLPPITVSVVKGEKQVQSVAVTLSDIPEQSIQQATFEITAPSLFASVVLDPDSDILNIEDSGRKVSLLLVWARQPSVILAGTVVVAAACALIVTVYKRHRRPRPPVQAPAGQAAEGPE